MPSPSTFETLESASLWDAGIRHGLEERGMFIQYVPLVRRGFWESLDAETQAIFFRVWREAMASARAFYAERQAMAKAKALQHGVTLVPPHPDALDRERAKLRKLQDAIASELKVPQEIVSLAEQSIRAASAPQRDPDE